MMILSGRKFYIFPTLTSVIFIFQKEIIKAAEEAIGDKHIENGTKLVEDCSKYGADIANYEILAKTASIYGDARKHVEIEQDDLNMLLSKQVAKVVSECMHNYLMYEHLLEVSLIPPDHVHLKIELSNNIRNLLKE